ncbi:putative transcriptional regulator with HTH domain [Sporocytophaga myxococcoides]|uniref:Putative transcriptional regulator with HTH domain n=1 Tax=Sporocytophaga myxococcoides TaxID=153721 RepID=A0A098LEH1_9BACT|nr:ATP-binding protein [Sporocytophaga myxococcoides]GAL85310.1 putative transcriptional regulator with HTH domain [Sporocytophaga myxococcoides]
MNLRQQIRQGENEVLDFKQTIGSVQKIAKTIVAFANTKGGRIMVGVRDNGSIAGAKAEEERHMLEGAASFFCKPEIKINFTEEVIDGKSILIAEVPESDDKPHYSKGEDGKWWAYIRVKDQCLLASKVMLDVMKSDTKGFDAQITIGKAEKIILEYLEHNDRITLKAFCKIANISRWRASRILVNLVRMKLIKVLSHEKEDYYSL